ncbi:MAG TPA: ribonuclease HI [Terrimicrobiaceae bacterium]|nr:ribonuclease HI [Terrimicrobiaceae bacterium]
MKKVVIHSDGGCRGNPGPGAWAAVLTHGPHVREISGAVPATTNNRMELQAAIEALNALKQPCAVEFFTDSQYVQNGITQWLPGWKRNGWRTKAKHPVKNADLWQALDLAASRHQLTWRWVKGHAGHHVNERCDILANQAMDRIIREHTCEQLRQELQQFVAASAERPDTPPPLL